MSVTHSRPRLFYERQGSGEPLLFVTGFTISSAVFEPVLPLYGEHFDVITYDNRSSGRSQTPKRLTSIPELAADAARLLDVLGIESAHVYGLSMGGMIAQELALRFPEKVRGLILGGTSTGGPRAFRPGPGDLGTMLVGAARALGEPGRPWLAPLLFSDEYRRRQPQRVRELVEHFTRWFPTPVGINAHWWASVFHDTYSRLDQIQAPTLVLHGAKDRMDPLDNSRLLARRIPDAELGVVPGSGHAYLLERPETSRRMLMEWLERKGPIAAGTPRTDPWVQLEPVTRALSLHTGALRTGKSLVGFGLDALMGRRTPPASRAGDEQPPAAGDEQPLRSAA